MIGKRAFNVRIAALTAGAAIVATIVVAAQTRQKGPWWPNPTWGPDDQSGASNRITPDRIVQSLRLVKTDKV